MTIAVDLGRKATKTKQMIGIFKLLPGYQWYGIQAEQEVC